MRSFIGALASCVLVVSVAVHAQDVTGTIKFSDSAQTKLLKTPIGTYVEAATKLTSKHTIVLNVPGVDPAQFNASTAFSYTLQESSTTDYEVKFNFSEADGYSAGNATIKKNFVAIAGVVVNKNNVLVGASIKIAKDKIAITINDKVRSVYALQFVNVSTKGSSNSPEGPGTGGKTTKAIVTIGNITATFDAIPYAAKYTNKSKTVNGVQLWAGSCKGTAGK